MPFLLQKGNIKCTKVNKLLAFCFWVWYNQIYQFMEILMAISYNKLWKKLIDLEMSRTEMRIKAGISTKTLAKLGKNENVNTDVLVKVCEVLGCNVDEIMDVVEKGE